MQSLKFDKCDVFSAIPSISHFTPLLTVYKMFKITIYILSDAVVFNGRMIQKVNFQGFYFFSFVIQIRNFKIHEQYSKPNCIPA